MHAEKYFKQLPNKKNVLLVFEMTLNLLDSDVMFIKQLPGARIATATKSGNPRVRPVWPVFDGKHIYFATDPGTVKLRHIKENPDVSIVFDDYDRLNWSNLKGIRIQGTATILDGGMNTVVHTRC